MATLVTGSAIFGVEPAAGQTGPGFLLALHSAKALDIPGGSHEPGTPIVQWTFHGRANQAWTAVPFGNDVYAFFSVETGQVLDVKEGSTAPGTRVIQWPWNGGLNQLWVAIPFSDLIPGGDPSINIIISAKSGQVLTIADASVSNGASAVQRPWTGGLNQIWSALLLA